MRKILILGMCVAGSISPVFAAKTTTLHAPQTPMGPKIRVLLEKDVNSVILESKGPYRIIRKDTSEVLTYGGGKRFVVHAIQDGLRWGEEFPDIFQVSVIPASNETKLYVNGIQYDGAISVYHVQNNQITVVNEVAIEDYLKSTLSISLKNEETINSAALSALVILSRTEAFLRASHSKAANRPWDIAAKEAKYYGFGITQSHPRIEQHIDKTRFMVVDTKSDQKLYLNPQKAEELADRGYDAKKILSIVFQNIQLGVTINPDEVALR